MTYEKDPRVDAYIKTLPDWQQAICREVRDLVHSADPDVTETIKRTSLPYFVLDGNICALVAAKDHVNIFLYDGAIVPDPEGESSRAAMTTRWHEQLRFPETGQSTSAPSEKCSHKSSPIIALEAGGNSSVIADSRCRG